MMSIAHTPYRTLGQSATTPEVAGWAKKRSVYRGGHETFYVAETASVADARDDLATLEKQGWIVTVQPLALDGSARVTMRYSDQRRVA